MIKVGDEEIELKWRGGSDSRCVSSAGEEIVKSQTLLACVPSAAVQTGGNSFLLQL